MCRLRVHIRAPHCHRRTRPRNGTERLLADIWSKMFGIDEVGIHDNFFELGGDSVLNYRSPPGRIGPG